MSIILCGRPKECRYCEQVYYGLLHIVQYIRERGYVVYDLSGSKCIRSEIYDKLENLNPSLFAAMGHGYIDTFTDNNEAIVWRCGYISCSYPPGNLKNRIVYLWSCLTARELGPEIINYGATAYIGFNEEWIWVSSSPAGDPYNDPYARCFFDSGNEVIKALVDGCTVKEAVQRAIDRYNQWIEYWKQSNDVHATECIKYLAWDRDALVSLGNVDSRVFEIDDSKEIEF